MVIHQEYLYDRFEFTEEYKQELVEFIRHNTNVEIGGYRMWDGTRTHLMQSPWELADFIFALKRHEADIGHKILRFLEVGFSSGQNNSILNKFFNFNHIVGLDLFNSNTNGSTLQANMQHKNLVLITGDSTSDRVINLVGSLGLYDLIFIDANHEYEYVKKDFENFRPLLEKGGVIAFHDVCNPDWMGVNKFWKELEDTGKYNMQTFFKSGNFLQYGIGMLTIK
jgi:hypothetical protein